MRKLKAVVLGYGDRSSRYADYAAVRPDLLEIVGVIDVLPYKLAEARQKFGLTEAQTFSGLDEFLRAGVKCDFVINGTMDELHYETSMKLLRAKYDILLEKPICPTPRELLELRDTAEENGCKIVVCHVLRYTPFYSTIKQILDSGEIGKIVDIQMNEHVWYGHFVNAFVRGKWRSEKLCGSGLLLAKCCHDLDLMCWLNNSTSPAEVSSFGAKAFFCEENAPEGATKYCFDCPARGNCMFDAYKFELEKDFIPFYTWAGLKKPIEEITREEKEEFLKHDVYGQCVYRTDMDLVDRQCVSVNFKNGSIGTLNLVAGTSKAGRHVHIICTMGEIVGYIEDNKFILRRFDSHKIDYSEEVIDLEEIKSKEKDNSVAGHYGGDYYIMADLVKYLNGEPTSAAMTVIEDSVNGHLCCYAAEKARKESAVVNLDRTYRR